MNRCRFSQEHWICWLDEELEKIVAEMRQITGQNKPYKNIPKLPELRTKFMTAYSAILEREEKPVIDAIDKAKARVIEVLNTKEYAEEKREKYSELFREIHDGAEKCNNVSALRSFADNADALKIRLMNEMEKLQVLGLPLLVGISRKSMIFKLLQSDQSKALNGTTVLNTISLMKGADILRVHDVKEAVECVKIFKALNS